MLPKSEIVVFIEYTNRCKKSHLGVRFFTALTILGLAFESRVGGLLKKKNLNAMDHRFHTSNIRIPTMIYFVALDEIWAKHFIR